MARFTFTAALPCSSLSTRGITLALALALTLALPATTCGAFASQPPAALKEAIGSYNGKQYGKAISQLHALGPSAAQNPYTHYYLALSYQALGQYAEAEKEYKWNYDHNLDSDLRYKSWQGLQGLSSAKGKRSVSLGTGSATTASSTSAGSGPPQMTTITLHNKRGAQSSGDEAFPIHYEWKPGCIRHGGGQ